MERTCSTCGETKPVGAFPPDKKRGQKSYCRTCDAARSRAWYHSNRDKAAERARRNYKANPGRDKAADRRARAAVIEAYGGRCACCGESIPEFLSIDHTNNDGAEQRRTLKGKSGTKFYKWLRARGFPKDGYQLLCFNCNCAKGFFGECPHARARVESALALADEVARQVQAATPGLLVTTFELIPAA